MRTIGKGRLAHDEGGKTAELAERSFSVKMITKRRHLGTRKREGNGTVARSSFRNPSGGRNATS